MVTEAPPVPGSSRPGTGPVPDGPASRARAAHPVLRLWGQARGVRLRLLGAAVVGALASGCAVALMATSAWLIARAAQQPPVLYLMVAVVSVRALGIGRGVLRYVERLISHDAAFRVLGGIRERFVAHLAAIAPAALPLWRRGDLLARTVDDVDDAGDAFLRGLLPLAGAALVGAGTIVLSFLILPAAGIALAVALAIACVLLPVLSARRSARIESRSVQLRADRTRLVSELLDDLPELTVSGGLPARLGELDRIETDHRRVAAGTARAGGVAAAIAVAAMGAAVWLATWFAVPAVLQQNMDPVLLAVVVLTPLALTDVVQAVGLAGTALNRATAALRRLFSVMDTPPVTAPAPAHPAVLPDPPGGPTVRLRGVAARWPGADRDALTDIDLDLAPGRRIVVVGESGSGKSTLIAVLLGFLTPTAGRITVDGVDVATLDPDTVRTLFSWCDQRAYLFDSTVLENVRLARPDASEADIAAALRDAGAGPWLDGLPQGMNTRVGEHGRAVSGGERQRVALARAIVADRPVLLADEPAAHLDAATADRVTERILRPDPGRCVLLVTHRGSDEDRADEVVRLHGGRRIG